jgi:hypothetical protein
LTVRKGIRKWILESRGIVEKRWACSLGKTSLVLVQYEGLPSPRFTKVLHAYPLDIPDMQPVKARPVLAFPGRSTFQASRVRDAFIASVVVTRSV